MGNVNAGWDYLLRRGADHHGRRVRGALARVRRTPVPLVGSLDLAATGAAVRVEVQGPQDVRMERPAALGPADWRAFRYRDVATLPPQFVLDVPDALVLGRNGWVALEREGERRVVSDLWQEVGFATGETVRPGLLATPPQERLAGTTVSLLLPWMPNYYHWTLQSVPRVDMVAGVVEPEAVDQWLVPPQTSPFVREWLDLLRIPEDRRVEVEPFGRVLSLERLVVASVPARNRYVPSHVLRSVRGRLDLGQREDLPRRIFLDRPATDKRRLLNRDEVLSAVRARGFEVVETGGRSVAEQAALFASADVVAGVLGAGLTNLVYCRPGTAVVEILPRNLMFPAYRKLCAAVGLDHRIVVGREPRLVGPLRFPDTEADVAVDVAALERTLEDVLR
jgi:capsular polysaccharide biosynthesis protein